MSWGITILLVDDHALLRATLSDRLGREEGMSVVGSVSNAGDAVVYAKQLNPDVVLMDIDMPGKICFDAAREIRILNPRTRIIFLSAFFHDRYIQDALAAGAMGYVTKDESPEVLVKAIQMVISGLSYFSPTVRSRLVVTNSGISLAEKQESRVSLLTKREIETLRYMARGLTREQMTQQMQITIKTLDSHISRLKKKLQIRDRVELSRFAFREGLVSE